VNLVLAANPAPYITGLLALLGSLTGALIAIYLSQRSRAEGRRTWLNDKRQDVYPNFIAAAQCVLYACEEWPNSMRSQSVVLDQLQAGYADLVVQNALAQTLATRSTIAAIRRHMYTLIELRDIRLDRKPNPGPDEVDKLLRGARRSRHLALEAIRNELDVPDTDGLVGDLAHPIAPLRVQATE
jgi:hypothetical protein